jgi:BirA family biotin operon repressor/biotin-[acetyl-CoA-carboxylase] ligase
MNEHPVIDPFRVERETFVAEAEVHAELASTNDRALRLANTAAQLPRLIVALRQTAGRGRGANRWWAGDGALTFSLLLDAARLPLERWPQISLTAGGAVCAALTAFLPTADVRLKWPNDVYVDGRKACGILVEVPPAPATGRIVIGIGLNVNNSLDEAPPDVRARATSLIDVTGTTHDMTDVLIAILQRLDADLAALGVSDTGLPARWRRLCLLSGRSVALHDGTRSIAGTCLGIDDDGALLLQTEAGPRRFFGGVVEAFA